MRAGQLDRRIRFEQVLATGEVNDVGEPVERWVTFREVWARKRSLQGSERFANQQFLAEVDAVYETRHFDDITPREELRFVDVADGRAFDIKAVHEIGRREGLELFATARAE